MERDETVPRESETGRKISNNTKLFDSPLYDLGSDVDLRNRFGVGDAGGA